MSIVIPPPKASGGGASFASIPLQPIDPSTWSEVDPSSLLTSVSYAGGSTSFTMAAGAGTGDYCLGVTGTHLWPRLYTALKADAGDGSFTQVTSDDRFLVVVKLSGSTNAPFACELVCAIAADPTSNVDNTMQGYGAVARQPVSANLAGGCWAIDAVTVSANASFDATWAVLQFNPLRGVSVSSWTVNAAGGFLNQQNRNINQSYSSGLNLQLMVGVATQSSAITIGAGDVVTLDFEYQVLKLA